MLTSTDKRPAPHMIRNALVAGFLVMAMWRPALAGLESGVAAYDGGNYTVAYGELLPLAERGDAAAAYIVSRMLFAGQGAAANTDTALKWLRLAAEKGEPNAQAQLAIRYDLGIGLAQSDADAFAWYARAARKGEANAQLHLGIMHSNGRGVAADLVLAHMWLNLSAATLPPGPIRNSAVKLRDAVTAQLTPAQVAAAHRLARDWRPTTQE
ncbi:MAG: sel1 repeat family protein [Alphaproteobacteria bacterium]|nr:sel1 repeat family protein [Alphaproteobacteria bacterium]